MPRLRDLIAAFALGAGSVAGSVYYVDSAISYRLLKSLLYRQQVTIPPSLLPPNVKQPLVGKPLDADAHRRLAAAIWREPMLQPLANTLYVGMRDDRAPTTLVERQVTLLSALGWRSTAAQENLIIHDLLDAPHIERVVDRGDALLRRRQVLGFANQMLATLEATPQTREFVIRRLAQRPPWRSDYLVATSQSATPAFLAARIATVNALMQLGSGPSNREIAPVLNGLVASGNGAQAYRLWARYAGKGTEAPVVNDGDFRDANRRGPDAEIVLPFDWRFQSDIGADAEPADDGSGVAIDWSGRGVPVFLSQLVPVTAGDRYALTIAGDANAIDLGGLLSPALVCNGRQVLFDVVANSAGAAAFRSDPVPAGCSIAQLVIAGRPRDTSAPVSATLHRVTMRSIG